MLFFPMQYTGNTVKTCVYLFIWKERGHFNPTVHNLFLLGHSSEKVDIKIYSSTSASVNELLDVVNYLASIYLKQIDCFLSYQICMPSLPHKAMLLGFAHDKNSAVYLNMCHHNCHIGKFLSEHFKWNIILSVLWY